MISGLRIMSEGPFLQGLRLCSVSDAAELRRRDHPSGEEVGPTLGAAVSGPLGGADRRLYRPAAAGRRKLRPGMRAATVILYKIYFIFVNTSLGFSRQICVFHNFEPGDSCSLVLGKPERICYIIVTKDKSYLQRESLRSARIREGRQGAKVIVFEGSFRHTVYLAYENLSLTKEVPCEQVPKTVERSIWRKRGSQDVRYQEFREMTLDCCR